MERIGEFHILCKYPIKYHVFTKKNYFLLCSEVRATERVGPRVDEDRKHRH